MKRYVLFDKESGEILHTHQYFKFGSDDFEKVPEEEVRQIFSRLAKPEKINTILTDEPYRSSYNFARKVDIKSGTIITTEHPSEYWLKRAQEKNSFLRR